MLGNSLTGISVLDFTQIAAGPTCTLMLADLGADVIKVESPSGDVGRALSPFINGESVGFIALNRNKRSVVLDLKNVAHVRIAQELAAKADIVVESFRPGVMNRLSLDYETLRAVNSKLIYCSISAYGADSPWKDLPGVDGVLQAVSGLMSITGTPGSEPCKVQVPIVDLVTGYLSTISVLAALAQRERLGKGQHLEVNMFSSAIALQHTAFAAYFATNAVPERAGSAAPYAAPNEALRCADGWVMVAAYQPKRWQALCEVLGVPELAVDKRFSELRSRISNRHELIEALERQMMKRGRSEWLERLKDADIICGPINSYREVAESKQFIHASLGERIVHPVAGTLTIPRFVLGEVGERTATRRPAPVLGEHTRDVLSELGYRQNEINRLMGILGHAT